MATLIELRQIRKSHGEHVLLDDVSVAFDDAQRVGLIGRNGTGKTTLVRILTGKEEADSGEVFGHRILRLGVLEQHNPFGTDETVLGFLERDSGQPDWRCGELAGRFGIKGADLSGPVARLSGGWQMRVKLAALLLHEPNFLVLDEPTNFLDLNTLLLLERFLRSFAGGCLVVSHDRAFLRAVCTHTLELSRGDLYAFAGPVDAYLEQQRQRRIQEERSNVRVRAKQRQLQAFIDRNRAGANTASQARNKQKQLDRLELIEIEGAEATAAIRLPNVEPRKGPAFGCDGLAIGYPEREVAREIRLDIDHGERVAVVGDNGEGKTTFLRTITGSLAPRAGRPRWGYGCEIGIYAQHVYVDLPEHLEVQQYLASRARGGTPTQTVLNVAGGFLFQGDAVEKPIRVLSGGERARLVLAGLFLAGHNVLVLDEPVNHLDVETTERLAAALCAFAGTVIFTSHDRSFMEAVATQVVEVRAGRIQAYPGDYHLYVARMQKRIEEAEAVATPPAAGSECIEPEPSGKEQARARYRLTREIAAVERQIARQQETIASVEARLHATSDWQALAGLREEMEAARARLHALEDNWLALQQELEAASG